MNFQMKKSYNFSYWILCSLCEMCYLLELATALTDSSSTFIKSDTDEVITCADFLQNSTFELSDIIDIEWKVLGFWNIPISGHYLHCNLKFSVPTDEFVKRFSQSNHTSMKNVDWSKLVMFADSNTDLSGVIFKTSRPGQFTFLALPSNYKYEPSNAGSEQFALKYLKEGFLMSMNCKHLLGLALAPAEVQFEDPVKLTETLKQLGYTVSISLQETREKREVEHPRDGFSIGEQENVDADSLLNDMKTVYNQDDSFF